MWHVIPCACWRAETWELQGYAHLEVTRVKKMDSTSSKEADDAVKS